MRPCRQPKWLPHVHDGKADARALLGAKPGVELRQARFRAILAAKPDRTPTQEVADDDPVAVALADRDLVDPDHPWARSARMCELRRHVLHLQRLDRVPVERQLLRHVRDRCLPTAPTDKIRKALGVERIVRQKLQPLTFHLAAVAAVNTPHLQFQKYPRVPA